MARRQAPSLARDAPVRSLPMDAATWQAVATELDLSPQQTRIVELILRGRQDKEIAAELSLSVPTVRTYLKRIFDRTQVVDRMGLVLQAFALAQELTTRPKSRRQR
jgi:DNA-binding NarL/FixJ family response regulator